MNYSVASGDCLWNIVKNNYNCNSSREVLDTIDLIAKENNIKNINLIYVGASIVLPETDSFIKSQEPEKVEETKADEFDKWSGDETFEKWVNGEEVESFQMFDLDLSTYSKDLKQFAQGYVDKYDADGDGAWNQEEFIAMSTSGNGIPAEQKADYEAILAQAYADLNIDNDDAISAAEFASQLYVSDVDWDTYRETDGDVAASIDGKLDYVDYMTHTSLMPGDENYEENKQQKEAFYNYYYAEEK